MTNKLRNMGYILCVGATLVFLGGIGILNSGTEIADIWKTILVGFLSFFLIGLSFVSKSSFKLEKFDSYILFVGFATLVSMFISIGHFELFGEWFSFNGDGCYLFLASIAILMSILLILMKVKTKLFFFYELAYITFIFTIYFVVVFFTENYSLSLIVLPAMLLIANIVSMFRKKFSIFTVFTFLSLIFNIAYIGAKEPILCVIFNAINMLSILAITYNYRNKDLVVIPTIIFGFNTILLYVSLYVLLKDANITSLIMAFVIMIYDIAFTFLAGSEKKVYLVISKIITCLFLLVTCLFANLTYGSIMYIGIIGTSLLSTFIIKNDSVEKYLLPFKVFFVIEVIFGHLCDMEYVNALLGHVICNIVAIISLILINEKSIRNELISIVLLSLVFILFVDRSVLTFIFGIVVALFDYVSVFFVCNKFRDSSYKKTFYIILLLYILFAVIRVQFDFYKYLICSIAYTILFVISYKDKLLAGCSLGFVVGSLLLYSYSLSEYRLSLYSAIIFGSLFAFAYLVADDKAKRNEFLNVAGSVFLIVSFGISLLDSILDVSFNVVFLIESVTMLIYSNIINKRFLFNSSMVITAGIIIRMLFRIEGIPTAVVVTLTGVIIIIVLCVMIKSYLNKDLERDIQLENPKYKFCGQCGTKLDINATICPTCSKKSEVESKFCGQCGTKLKNDVKFCPQCGDKIVK